MFTCELQLPATVRTPGRVREEVQRRFARTLPPRVVDDLKLLTTEVVTSTVTRDAIAPQQSVQVRIDLSRRGVHVEVLGPGCSPDGTDGHDARHDGSFSFDPSALQRELLDGLAARWGTLTNRPGCVWFELDL